MFHSTRRNGFFKKKKKKKRKKKRRRTHVTFGGSCCIDSLTDGKEKEKDEGVVGRGTKGYKDGQLGHTVQL